MISMWVWIIPAVVFAVAWFLSRSLMLAVIIGVVALLFTVGILNIGFNWSGILGLFT